MKFVKRIGDGEITIKDNEVKENTAKTASNWADDFSTNYSGQVLITLFLHG